MKLKLYVQVFIGIILGVFVGVFFREKAILFQPLGDIFIRLLRMIIVPLVFASMVMGIVSLGSIKHLGQVGARTFAYYLATTFMAVFIGLGVVNLVKPGIGTTLELSTHVAPETASGSVSIMNILLEIIPVNVFEAMVDGQMLGIIFFAIIIGCALISVGRKADGFVKVFDGLNECMLRITNWIMLLAPVGVFALVATLVGKMGLAAFKPLALYILTVMLGLTIHAIGPLFCFLIFVVKVSPFVFLKKMFPALATAFSTDSSLATLPVTIDCLEQNVGVSNKVTGFVAPLGATMNMDGTALYEAVAAMFIAQIYGIDLSFTQQLVICLTATLASIGAAGIPSAGLVTMVIVLRSVNLPLEGIGLILAVDRILDMFRTVVNVFGDSVGAAVIATLDGENLAAKIESIDNQ